MELEGHGYLSLSEHPELKNAVEWQVACGNLVRVLGNCYTDAAAADSFEARVTAARHLPVCCVPAGDGGSVGGRSWRSKRCSWRPSGAGPEGFAFERREIPAELKVWNGEHFSTNPALTVLDLTDVPGER